MIGRLAALAALGALAACASMEPAGRNAREAAPAPPPAVVQTAPQAAQPAPQVAAPGVTVNAPPTPNPAEPQRTANGGDIVVPGQQERQVPVPDGDPRSASERMADIRAWDRCVTQVQRRADSDPTRPSFDVPEDVCRSELGMANRNAVPNRRR
ncbi:MAG TPA: hypothetical protein PKY87_07795 [Terricaulis sp.]|nr:hypothetical protein [Terricaulis sp.]